MAEPPVANVSGKDVKAGKVCVGESSTDSRKFVQLKLAENIAAYMKKQSLVRDVPPLQCNKSVVEAVMVNYIIVKEILKNLDWRDRLVCKLVCTTWYWAIDSLNKEHHQPQDFLLAEVKKYFGPIANMEFIQSARFTIEPLAVLTFVNSLGFTMTRSCKHFLPKKCKGKCDKEHCLLDLVRHQVNLPKECLLVAKALYLTYMPLPQSITLESTIVNINANDEHPFLGGIYIPMIPNVQFDVINLKSKPTPKIPKNFTNKVNKLAEDRLFKGVIVYVTENFLFTQEDIAFLSYIKEMQPVIPFAVGGCIVEDTLCDQSDIDNMINSLNGDVKNIITDNLISIGVFSVPKNSDGTDPKGKYDFDMFSLVIETSEWTRTKIQNAIVQFSKGIPNYEHSVVLKLSCVGRDGKHLVEQEFVRSAFPNARVVGCYGNGEIGVNHPPRPPPQPPARPPPSPYRPFPVPYGGGHMKRQRLKKEPNIGFIFSYSTVLVYIGWGKILKHPEI